MSTMNPPKQGQAAASGNRQQLLAIAAIVIVALLGVNAYLLYKITQVNNQKDALAEERDETMELRKKLDEDYQNAIRELDELGKENEGLKGEIEARKAELQAAYERIDKLVSQGNNSRARAEMATLRQQVDSYVEEINQLRQQNAQLSDENSQLAARNQELDSNLNMERQTLLNISADRDQLAQERDQLNNSNANLSRKVEQASAIKVAALEAVGQKVRQSGKAVTRTDADNVERLAIRFQTTVNEIVQPGQEEFVVRIVNPAGETMAVEQMGSGSFTNRATGEAMRYTLKDKINYDRSPQYLDLIWAPGGLQFSPGNYTVEVYNKGYLVGSTVMRLK